MVTSDSDIARYPTPVLWRQFPPGIGSRRIGPMRILLIEDDPLSRNQTQELWTR